MLLFGRLFTDRDVSAPPNTPMAGSLFLRLIEETIQMCRVAFGPQGAPQFGAMRRSCRRQQSLRQYQAFLWRIKAE